MGVTEQLKPCPFCGGDDVRLQQNGYTKLPDGSRKPTWWEVACMDCDFVGPGDDREKVIEHWNRRAEEPQ